MSESKYQNLIAWQKARELAVLVYRASSTFPRSEIYGLTQQIRRAAISVASNIAEGYGRRSPRETLQFLGVARGSLYEVETQIVIAGDLDYLDGGVSNALTEQTVEVIRLVRGLIRYFERLARP